MKNLLQALSFLFILGVGMISEFAALISEDQIVLQYLGQESKEGPIEKDVEKVDKKLFLQECALSCYYTSAQKLRVYIVDAHRFHSEPPARVQTPPPEFG